MFCPRCGRAINENANFCGGCGLSRVEIEKFAQTAKVAEAPAQPTQPAAEVPFGSIVNEPVAEPVAEPAETVAETCAAQCETETPEAEAKPTAQTGSYTAPAGAEYHYTAQNNPANSTDSSTQYSYTAPQTPVKKSENLSTVDFIWMMVISAIPVIGLIYIIYLAIQDNNTNKRSYARATLIIAAFSALVGIVFALGFLIAGLGL